MQTMNDLPVALAITQKKVQNFYLHSNTFEMSSKSFSHLMPLLNCGQVNPSTPIFPDINLTQTMTDLLVA